MEIDKSQCLCWSQSQPLVRAAQEEHGRGRKAHVEPEGSSSSIWRQVANCTPCLYWKILSLFQTLLLESNCFSVVLVSAIQQSQLYQYTHPLSCEPPPTQPCYSRGASKSAESCSLCPTAASHGSYSMYDSVYISVLLSQFVPPSPSSPVESPVLKGDLSRTFAWLTCKLPTL